MATRHVVQIVLALPKPIVDLIARARVIVAAVRAKPALFPSPHPPLAEIDDCIQALDQAQVVATGGATGTVAARKVAEIALRKKLRALGAYVEWIANATSASFADAVATLEAAACTVKAVGRYNKPLLEAKRGPCSGAVLLVAKAGLKNRVFYDWRYSLDRGETWVLAPSTNTASTTLEGLPVGAVIWFQHRMTIRNVVGDWGQTVSIVVT